LTKSAPHDNIVLDSNRQDGKKGGLTMIGLEYILNLHGVQHQKLAEMFGIKKQNINRWIKGKQNISKKYLPELSGYFDLPEALFQKELTEIDRLNIQKVKLHNEMKPYAFQQQLIFKGVNDLGEM